MHLWFLLLRRPGPQAPGGTDKVFEDVDGLLVVLPEVEMFVDFHSMPDDGFDEEANRAISIDVALSSGGGSNPTPVLREQVSGGSGFTMRVNIVVPHWVFAAFSSICFQCPRKSWLKMRFLACCPSELQDSSREDLYDWLQVDLIGEET